MKKISKMLMVVLFGVVGLSSGVVRAGEERSGQFMLLCEDYCGWCETTSNWHCELQHCNPQSQCQFESSKLITCLHEEKVCTSENCVAEQEAYEACKDTFPACGDGFVSGDEECDYGLGGNVHVPRHGTASCGDDCKLHPDCEFEAEGCPQNEGGHEGH